MGRGSDLIVLSAKQGLQDLSYPEACCEEIYKCVKTAPITMEMNNILLSFPTDYEQDFFLSLPFSLSTFLSPLPPTPVSLTLSPSFFPSLRKPLHHCCCLGFAHNVKTISVSVLSFRSKKQKTAAAAAELIKTHIQAKYTGEE